MAKRTTNGPATRRDDDPLQSFLASMDRFVETISAQMLEAVATSDDRAVIESTAESFVAQTRKLTDYTRELVPTVTPMHQRELEPFLRVQDSNALVERSLKVSAAVLSGGGGGVTLGFLSWINEILFTLKKIIREIWSKFFGGVPDWLETILIIIDELANLLKSLFGSQFGHKMGDIADQASKEEINHLGEMRSLAQLRAARTSLRTADDEPRC
jgi:hypothetical protein